MKAWMTILLLTAAGAMSACGGSPSTPSAPPPPPPPAPVQLAQFTDAGSGLMTNDVRDVDEQVVRFDTNNRTLIWQADGRTFSGFTVNGNIVNVTFQVRFGKKNGECRAYFTETARPFICNIEIASNQVTISATDVPVPAGC